MKPRLAAAAADRLVNAPADAESAMGEDEDEVLRVLARIARTGKPSDRPRAAELIGRQLGMFREKPDGSARASYAEVILEARRQRSLQAVTVAVADQDATVSA
jgi:hypothetical protein